MRLLRYLLFASLLFAACAASAQIGFTYDGIDISKESEFVNKADSGDIEAAYKLGFTYSVLRGHKDSAKALKYLGMAAEKNHAKAEWALGNLYVMGAATGERDFQKAAEYFIRSADHGYSMGQAQACSILNVGRGIAKDPVRAFAYCRKAAEQGDPYGEMLLGEMYVRGEGTPIDEVEGRKWIAKSAAAGFPFAQEALARLKAGAPERPTGMPSTGTTVVAVVRNDSPQGDPISQAEFEKLMQDPKVKEDPAIAVALYEKAAQSSANPIAWFELGRLYEQGKGVTKNDERALDLFLKAARQEFIPALFRLGQKYRDSEGVARDNEESYKFFALAAMQGSEEAMNERDGVARLLSPEQVARAQTAAETWLKNYPKIDPNLQKK